MAATRSSAARPTATELARAMRRRNAPRRARVRQAVETLRRLAAEQRARA